MLGAGIRPFSQRLVDDKWHLVAVTSDGVTTDNTQLYVDGILEVPSAFASGSINTAASNDVSIGSYNDSSHFVGYIDGVRIYDRQLTAPELA